MPQKKINDAVVLYHGHCQDGLAAGFIAKSALEHAGSKVLCVPVVYDGKFPDDSIFVDKDVYCVDYCPKDAQLLALTAIAATVAVLDHHASSKALFHSLFETNVVSGVWDDTRSGAGITWDYFYPKWVRPELIDYIEDRDLNRKALPSSDEVHLSVSSYPFSFESFSRLMTTPIADLAADGAIIMRKRLRDISVILQTQQVRLVMGEYNVPAVNAPHEMATDLGALLSDYECFSAIYSYNQDGIKFSLRSDEADGADVNEIAKRYGGGGHKHAAGFTISHNALTFKDGRAYLKAPRKRSIRGVTNGGVTDV